MIDNVDRIEIVGLNGYDKTIKPSSPRVVESKYYIEYYDDRFQYRLIIKNEVKEVKLYKGKTLLKSIKTK
ncbi:MAG: hypothetical protein J6T15_04945 [Bacilli bacterium]|jgi:hypothetical protein|nr:hypothetical protein [Bacilli bacterium]